MNEILQNYMVVAEEDKNIITKLTEDNITLINNYELNKLKFKSCKEENKKLKKDLEKFKNDTNNTMNDAEKTLEILEKSNKILQQQINKCKTQTQYLKLEIEAAKNSLVLKDTELKACLAENQTITANLDITKKILSKKT